MSDKMNEQLSALMDDELADRSELLGELGSNMALRAGWARYHLIRDVMTDHLPDQPYMDISARVSASLEQEPAIFAPLHKRRRPSRLRFMAKQVAGLAIAATVSAVAVLSVQQHGTADSPAAGGLAATTPAAIPAPTTVTPRQASAQVRYVTADNGLDQKTQSKLSGYLVNHNEYSVSANMQGLMPYMRIVSVTPGQRVVVRAADAK